MKESTQNSSGLLIDIVESYAARIKAVAILIYGALDVLTPYYDILGYEKGPMIMGKDDVSYIMTKFIDENEWLSEEQRSNDSSEDSSDDLSDDDDSKRQRI